MSTEATGSGAFKPGQNGRLRGEASGSPGDLDPGDRRVCAVTARADRQGQVLPEGWIRLGRDLRIADRMARVTLSRARSARDAAWRSRPPSPTALASSLLEEVQLPDLGRPSRVVEGLRLVQLGLEIPDPGPVGILGGRVEHLARITEVRAHVQLVRALVHPRRGGLQPPPRPSIASRSTAGTRDRGGQKRREVPETPSHGAGRPDPA